MAHLSKDSVVQILEQAMEGNTIAVIPKGFHRIFVASMLIKEKYTNNAQSLLKHNKVVCLVKDYQSMNYWDSELKKNVSFSIAKFDKCPVDSQNISQYDVILMTPDVFIHLINCDRLTFENICLLIIDECQNAVTNQSLIMISNIYKQQYKKPHTIGFTSSIISPESTLESLPSDIEKLKDTFSFSVSILHSTKYMCTVDSSEFIKYSSQTDKEEENWTPIIAHHFENIYILDLILYAEHDKPNNIMFKNTLYSHSWNDLMRAMECFVIEVYNTLGLYAAEKAILLVLMLIKKYLFSACNDDLTTVLGSVLSSVVLLRKKMLCALEKCSSDEQYPFNQCSPKLKAFLLTVQQFKENEYNLIFVEYPETAMVLCYVLNELLKTNDLFKHVKPDYLINADFHSTKTKEMSLYDTYNGEALKCFLLHESNVLFTLYQIEELDKIPICNVVIILDKPTSFKSYYQAKEKTMQSKSNLIIVFEEKNNIEFDQYENYKKIETLLLSILGLTSDSKQRSTSTSLILAPITTGSVESVTFKSQREEERTVSAENCKDLYKMDSCYLDTDEYFPRQISEPGIIAGKKCNIRDYQKTVPEWLVESNLDAAKVFYIHVVQIISDFDQPSKIDNVYFDLLNSSQTISITSTKKWPNLSSFYLFSREGRLKIRIFTNFKIIEFTKEEVEAISNFQKFVFIDLIPLVKPFMVRNNDSNSTFVIPTILSDTEFNEETALSVDWEAIRGAAAFPKKNSNSMKEAKEIKDAPINFHGKVIIPHHKKLNERSQNEWCLIKSVNAEKTPNSEMNLNNGYSFADYFKNHYNTVIQIKDQPLVEVLTLPAFHQVSLNRVQKKRDNSRAALFTMTLVPELCTFVYVPAAYILKMSFLPCILHRIYQLMVSETIRLKIFNNVGLGKQECSTNVYSVLPVKLNPNLHLFDGIEITNSVISSMKSLLSQNSSWISNDEPRDIFRDLYDADFIDLVHFRHFVAHKNQESLDKIYSQKPNPNIYSITAGVEQLTSECRSLTILSKNNLDNSPNLWDILNAITCQSANDFTGLDQLKNLGYSFLNIISSLAAFKMHSNLDISQLREIRNKLVGRSNIFYCGIHIELGSLIQNNELDLLDCNIPPYAVDRILNCLYQGNVIPIKLITDMELDATEQDSGIYSAKTIEKIGNAIMEHSSGVIERAYYPCLFGINYISDNDVSDCTAALIATYLESCGIPGAIKLCNWLGINIPESIFLPTPYDNINYNGVLEPAKIEKTLNYSFSNKGFLHQAFVQYSFIKEDSSFNQSLIFLGEAIIDFLLATFIHEHYKDLTRDDALSLQHALNNDIVFACLSVRYSFHKHICYTSFEVWRVINSFVSFQEHRDLEIGPETLLLVNESDVGIEENFDVPQVLSDIFKSLIAAVFLDSDQNLDITWDILHSLMNQEIMSFSRNIPKDIMINLKNKFHNPGFAFSKTTTVIHHGISRALIYLQVKLPDGPLVFSGYGEDKQKAKRAAAKMALRHWGTKFMIKRKR